MPRRVRKAAYSRIGCATCKQRHKKCDGNKPRCNACVRRNLKCEQSDGFRNFQPESPEPQESPNETQISSLDGSRSISPTSPASSPDSLPAQVNNIPALSQQDWQYFQYYVERLSDLLLNGHTPYNPLRSLIVPRMTSSPLLLQAVCSISAQHRANGADIEKPQFQTAATAYYLRALSKLKQWIPYISWLQDTAQYGGDTESLETAVLVSIFLCKHEIIKAGVANWRSHLVAIESFCHLLGSDERAGMSEVVMYARSFVMYHRSTTSVTDQSALMLGNTCYDQPLDLESYSSYIVDPYMGISQTLVLTLQRVSHLLNFESDNEIERLLLTSEIESILQLIKERSWTLKLAFIPREMSPASTRVLIYVARAYESAILAYLHSVIDSLAEREVVAENNENQQGSLSFWQGLHDLVPSTKEEAVADCIVEILQVPVGAPEEPGLLPLLFIVACIAESPEDTWIVLERVEGLAVNFRLGNMDFIGAFVREVWRQRVFAAGSVGCRIGWRELLARSKWDLMLS